MKKYLILPVLLISISASAQFKYVQVATKRYNETSPSEVRIYLDENKVPKDAQEIGLIICETNNDKRAYKKAKKIAANHGANGLYITKQKERTNGEKWMNTLFAADYSDKTTFVAIHVPFNSQ